MSNEGYGECKTYRGALRDDVTEERSVNLSVVPALLELDTIDLFGLNFPWSISRVDLGRCKQKGPNMIDKYTSRTQYFPAFFLESTSSASGEYPGAIIPSETSREMILAVAKSQGADSPMKSPKEDMRSAPRARAYAQARGVKGSFRSSTP